MDEYIVKYLLKKNKGMSQSDAEKKLRRFGIIIVSTIKKEIRIER